jgi:hypothetical protein
MPSTPIASSAGTVFQSLPESQQSMVLEQRPGASSASAYQLPAQRALSLRAAQAGVLRVLRGSLWATRQWSSPGLRAPRAAGAAHSAWLDDADAACKGGLTWPEPALSGDIVVQAGQAIPLRAQDRLVVEALHSPASGPLLFSFEAAAQGGI